MTHAQATNILRRDYPDGLIDWFGPTPTKDRVGLVYWIRENWQPNTERARTRHIVRGIIQKG